jgi:hypothetical protein
MEKDNKPSFDFDISDIPVNNLPEIPLSYYQENRQKLVENMKNHKGAEMKEKSIAIFRGHHQHMNNCNDDATSDWQPEWNFFYLFGFEGEQDCYAVLDMNTGETVIAVQRKDEVHQIFEGGLKATDDPKPHGVDKFIWVDELQMYVHDLNPDEIFVLNGKIRDEMSHKASFPWLDDDER